MGISREIPNRKSRHKNITFQIENTNKWAQSVKKIVKFIRAKISQTFL